MVIILDSTVMPDLGISTCSIPQTEALSKGFSFLFAITRLNTRGLFTSCPTHILPNSPPQPTIHASTRGRWKRSVEAPREPSYCLGELSTVLRVRPPFSPHTLFPVNHPGTPSAGPTVLSAGCLFAGTAFQVSKLKTSADNPNTKMKKENPWAVLLKPNKAYLYLKIATGYLNLQRLKRLGSLIFQILSSWEVEIQVS